MGLTRDLLKGLKRWPSSPGLDQVDGGPADCAARYLGQAEMGFLSCLTDRPVPNGDTLAPATVFTVEHGGEHTATLDSPLLE